MVANRVDPAELRGRMYSFREVDLGAPWWLLSDYRVVAELNYLKKEEKLWFFSVTLGDEREWAEVKVREFCDFRRSNTGEFRLVCSRTMRSDSSAGFIAHATDDLSSIGIYFVFDLSVRLPFALLSDWWFARGRKRAGGSCI